MLIPIERLIDGCLQTLREAVLPEVASRAVRGRSTRCSTCCTTCAIASRRSARPPTTEAESAADARSRARGGAARRPRDPEGAADLERALAAAPTAPPAARAAALRAALAERDRGAAARGLSRREREALRAHLAAQALRDVALLKPSLLSEISKG